MPLCSSISTACLKSLGTSYPYLYLALVLNFRILARLASLKRFFCFLARVLNFLQCGKSRRLLAWAYMAQDTGSSAVMVERGSSKVSPFSHNTVTLYGDPL